MTTYPPGWFVEPVVAWWGVGGFQPRLTNPRDPLCIMEKHLREQRRIREAEERGQSLADEETRRRRRESRALARAAQRAAKLPAKPSAGKVKASRGQPGRGPSIVLEGSTPL